MFNSNFSSQQKFVTAPLRVIPLSRNLRAHARTSYARKWNRGNVWKAARKRTSWARFTFYKYEWASIQCLYFIYARTLVKIARQWKSTLREKNNTKEGFSSTFLDWNDFNNGNTVKRCCAIAFYLNCQSPRFYFHTITLNTLLDFNCYSSFPSLSYCSHGLVKGTVTGNRRRVTEALY